MNRLLVTGGAGFIGSNFVRYMLSRYPEYQIVVLDKLTYAGNPANIADLRDNPNFSFVKGDICDQPLVDELDGRGGRHRQLRRRDPRGPVHPGRG